MICPLIFPLASLCIRKVTKNIEKLRTFTSVFIHDFTPKDFNRIECVISCYTLFLVVSELTLNFASKF